MDILNPTMPIEHSVAELVRIYPSRSRVSNQHRGSKLTFRKCPFSDTVEHTQLTYHET